MAESYLEAVDTAESYLEAVDAAESYLEATGVAESADVEPLVGGIAVEASTSSVGVAAQLLPCRGACCQ